MLAEEFEDRVARLEEYLVPETAEEALKEAEQVFAEEGNSVWARCALLRAQSIYARDQRQNEQFEARLLDEWEDDDDA